MKITQSNSNTSDVRTSIFLIIFERVFKRFVYIPLYALGAIPIVILAWEIDPNSAHVSKELYQFIAALAGKPNSEMLTEVDLGKAVAIIFGTINVILESILALTGRIRRGFLIKSEIIFRVVLAEIGWIGIIVIALIRREPADQILIPLSLAVFWPVILGLEYVMRISLEKTLQAFRSSPGRSSAYKNR